MTATAPTIEQPAGGGLTWYALSAQEVTAQMGVDADTGLTVAEVERRQAEYGPNELPTEPPPSIWVVAREQLMNPMNIMLLIVVAASFEALAKLQVPHARVRRSGQVAEIESTKLVPGDIVLLEAGDVVPADGRI